MLAQRVLIITGCCNLAFLIFVVNHATAGDQFRKDLLPVFNQHCIRCHGQDGEVNGDVDLLAVGTTTSLIENPQLLRELIDVIELREMPPEDEPRLEDDLQVKLIGTLSKLLQESMDHRHLVGQAPIRRMNRFQYNNAVTDLFDLHCVVFTLPERMVREYGNYFRPESGRMANSVTVGSRPLGKSQLIEPRLAGVASFPQDLRAEHGFDNRADHLSLSPLLMESFLKLSQSITESPDFDAKRVGIWDEFFAPPEDSLDLEREVQNRLEPLLTKAFRRRVGGEVLDRYTSFATDQIAEGVKFTDAMKTVASAVIASPKFFYLYDQASEGQAVEPLSELDLASRLSFFLWGSVPDFELIRLAEAGTLDDPDVLAAQVDRMLRDQKLKRFCDSFPSQWLQLERIISSVPNPASFPDFYYSKYRDSMHMMIEPLLLFETVLVENQSVLQFIDSDFTYRSPQLQDAYGESVPSGNGGGAVTSLSFDRLPVTDRRYGGLITNAAVMTMTSGPDRTQPITRGAWLATVIFNDPPEPPPADVPPLSEKPAKGEENLTLRERLDLHRERADCRGCHEKIDPLGFALENYNAIGVWRERYENGRDVDMSGVLFRKYPFTDVTEFKDAILAERDRFTRGFAGHVLSFALARQMEPSDVPVIEMIAEATAADDYHIQTLIKQVVLSEPFRSKMNPKRRVKAND